MWYDTYMAKKSLRTPHRRTFSGDPRKTRRWKAVSSAIRERDDYTCQRCGKWGNEVDHIEPLANGGSAFDLQNCQCLCSGCHVSKTRSERPGQTPGRADWILANRAYVIELERKYARA